MLTNPHGHTLIEGICRRAVVEGETDPIIEADRPSMSDSATAYRLSISVDHRSKRSRIDALEPAFDSGVPILKFRE